MYVYHMHSWCPQKSEESIRCPVTRVTDRCEPRGGSWDLDPGLLAFILNATWWVIGHKASSAHQASTLSVNYSCSSLLGAVRDLQASLKTWTSLTSSLMGGCVVGSLALWVGPSWNSAQIFFLGGQRVFLALTIFLKRRKAKSQLLRQFVLQKIPLLGLERWLSS